MVVQGVAPAWAQLRRCAAGEGHEQGVDAPALPGQKSTDMAAICRDTRGVERIEVKAG